MNKDFYITLISKRLSSELNAAELKVLNSWLNEGKDNANLLQEFRNLWAATAQYKSNISFNADVAFSNFSEKFKLNAKDQPAAIALPQTSSTSFSKYIWIPIILLGFLLGYNLISNLGSGNKVTNQEMHAMTIALNPASNATISPETSIIKAKTSESKSDITSRMELNTINDLNASALKANKLVDGITGQAYFNVDNLYNSVPYTFDVNENVIVATHKAKFNIQNYKDEDYIIIDVADGLLKVDIGNTALELEAGQRLVFNKITGEGNISNSPDLSPFKWSNGILEFDNTPLTEVFKKIERFYGIDIEVTDNSPVTGHFTAFNLKPGSLNECLELLQASIDMKITRKGLDKVLISEINSL
ncbi:MAG: DUF4974 domain-containing protein [Saprospiraceae bacterium]|nr:DUF4974 domain-containing protein [Saprospiraceae bacterium]